MVTNTHWQLLNCLCIMEADFKSMFGGLLCFSSYVYYFVRWLYPADIFTGVLLNITNYRKQSITKRPPDVTTQTIKLLKTTTMHSKVEQNPQTYIKTSNTSVHFHDSKGYILLCSDLNNSLYTSHSLLGENQCSVSLRQLYLQFYECDAVT